MVNEIQLAGKGANHANNTTHMEETCRRRNWRRSPIGESQASPLPNTTTSKKFNCDSSPNKQHFSKSAFAINKQCDLSSSSSASAAAAATGLRLVLMAGVVSIICLLIASGGHQINCQQLTTTTTTINNSTATASNIIIIDQQQQQPAAAAAGGGQLDAKLPAHFQPASVFVAHNRSLNFSHLTVDELSGCVYVGATNWLFQLSSSSLRLEAALRTGPAAAAAAGPAASGSTATTSAPTQQQQQQQSVSDTSPINLNNNLARDCSPGDCQAQLIQVVHEFESIPAAHAHHTHDLRFGQPLRRLAGPTLHTTGAGNVSASHALLTAQRRAGPQQVITTKSDKSSPSATTTTTTNAPPHSTSAGQTSHNNNYNKLLAIDYDARQLIVCGSLNQGACRRHQLGRLASFGDLVPLPVVPNDEHSSSVALVAGGGGGSSGGPSKSVLYVAATNSRLGPYRELVPAISGRHLDWTGGRAMQIIERSFTDTARVDISSELRDYYLVNYVHAFQHNDYVYFATQQRRSPLRQLEESGYITRLGRLCLQDLSFQSYVEMTLECVASPSSSSPASNVKTNLKQQPINYNLLQDAHLMTAGSHLQQQLGLSAGGGGGGGGGGHQQRPVSVLVGSFALSKDHTTKSSSKSAVCMFPMDRIEQRFNENIQLCFNGTSKSRNMNYIAGSVNDCPRMQTKGAINFCSEPIKLNASLPLRAEPIISFENELITSITSTLASTGPLSSPRPTPGNHQRARQHQVLVAGTSDGYIKKMVLVEDSRRQVRAVEFDSIQVDDSKGANSILADINLVPSANPQLNELANHHQQQQQQQQPANRLQFVIAASAHKIVKLPINTCKARRPAASTTTKGAQHNQTLVDDCLACAQLRDPFCGWCAPSSSCISRDECQQQQQQMQQVQMQTQTPSATHWRPFDSIECSHYRPIWPQYLPWEGQHEHEHQQQQQHQQLVEVNVRLGKQQLANANQLSVQLAHSLFACHFEHGDHGGGGANQTGATTKAGQARVNWDAGTATLSCPLPGLGRLRELRRGDEGVAADSARLRLTVRTLTSMMHKDFEQQQQQPLQVDGQPVERDLFLYQCSGHSDCGSCLSAGESGRRWACAWCPLSQRCTFNASHAEFGCAATAVGPTTTTMASTSIRGSHLSASLDRAQASLLAVSLDRLEQCPPREGSSQVADQQVGDSNGQDNQSKQLVRFQQQPQQQQQQQQEILIPNNVRRAIQVQLRQSIASNQVAAGKRVMRLECLIEFEGMKARFSGRLLDNTNVLCQEQSFNYLAEVATLRAQLSVVLNDHQVIETTEVILYKCHLFGVSPPALTSSFGAPGAGLQQQSSAFSWRAHELAELMSSSSSQASSVWSSSGSTINGHQRRQSDCSLCANIDRKFQCAWCSGGCSSAELCQELAASTCPPPRIDSIHPSSGPLEGGTLLTIEGSNLGASEREIQDKITVGGEPCQLIMYSVSTRIVCKTAPTRLGPHQAAAAVVVGNRAGLSSAQEKFLYKAVHLFDVSPKVGPHSGGTRLFLNGSNLNVGSRIQIYLDDIPCHLDEASHEFKTSQQLTCVTGPNLLATGGPRNISRLTLTIDNSSHQLAYPFAYLPDPIITHIEPAESFLSGGRLLLIGGQHLGSPQTVRLLVHADHQRHNILNGTTCITQNDTLITCLTPGLSRETAASLLQQQQQQQHQHQQQQQQISDDQQQQPVNVYEQLATTGLRLKMMLVMDDVKSVRSLDEYYHHLPHYLTYFEDPQLFRLASPVVEYTRELVIQGEHLKMRQLDQDMLITFGPHAQDNCTIKSIQANQVACEPPSQVAPVYDDNGRLLERPLLPIVALVGAHLRFPIGHMQYTSQQYRFVPQPSHQQLDYHQQQQQQQDLFGHMGFIDPHNHNLNQQQHHHQRHYLTNHLQQQQQQQHHHQLTQTAASSTGGGSGGQASSMGLLLLILLSVVGFVAAFSVTFMFALARFRQSKAEREYKRIQLQMGSLDVNGQLPLTGNLFDKHMNSLGSTNNTNGYSGGGQVTNNLLLQQSLAGGRGGLVDYVGGALSGKKLFYHFNQAPQMAAAASPLTSDVSSLFASSSSPTAPNNHLVRFTSNGTIINTTSTANNSLPAYQRQVPHRSYYSALEGSQSGSSQQSSPNSQAPARDNHQPTLQRTPVAVGAHNQQPQLTVANSRDFNWTQQAPSTIVPYAVIEACNLSLETKANSAREFV